MSRRHQDALLFNYYFLRAALGWNPGRTLCILGKFSHPSSPGDIFKSLKFCDSCFIVLPMARRSQQDGNTTCPGDNGTSQEGSALAACMHLQGAWHYRDHDKSHVCLCLSSLTVQPRLTSLYIALNPVSLNFHITG